MKTLVAIPCMDTVPTAFMRAILNCRWLGDVEISFAQGSLVYDARNTLAKKAISEGFERVLWIDSDMTFGPDLFSRLSDDLDMKSGMVSAIYYKRKEPIEPVIYESLTLQDEPGGLKTASAKVKLDLPKNEIVQIDGCGFGAVMMQTEYLKAVSEKYGLPFYPTQGFGEDLSFCWRLKELGLPIFADTSIQCGHVGQYEFTFNTYEKGEPILWKNVI